MGRHSSKQNKHGGRQNHGDSKHGSSLGWGHSEQDRHDSFRGEQSSSASMPHMTFAEAARVPNMPRLVTVATIGIFIGWALLAVVAYSLVDIFGGWLSANSSVLLQGGKDLASAAGVGQVLVDKVDMQGTTTFVQQLLTGVLTIARPAIVILWIMGALAIVAAPFVLRRFRPKIRQSQRTKQAND